jgi:eukaryotic-like serine/threonine-protein kinase
MTAERWQQVKALFQAASELATAERAAFLAAACAEDDGLRREVESLLATDAQAGSFLKHPVLAIDTPANKTTAVQAELEAGQMISHYRIERGLGAGGMGVVYLARDTQLGRPVALKLLPVGLTQDTARVRRFQQEARAASALNHPNILTIYEVGQANLTAGGTHFIAAEFVDGPTLREQCNAGGMSLGAALELLIQVASALAAAHAAGIVHRDIKPENLMQRRDGLVKVLDFGLAKLLEKDEGGRSSGKDEGRRMKDEGGTTTSSFILHPSSFRNPSSFIPHPLTAPGVVMGTVSYMSPEQARGLEVDTRSDLFSLGVVMYELLTGHAPFTGETSNDVLVVLLSGEPRPLARYSASLPTALQEIVNRALAKPVEQRYQTARELGADLKRLKAELSFAARLKGKSASRDDILSLPVGVATETVTPTTFATNTLASAPRNAPRARRRDKRWTLTFTALVLLIAGVVWGWRWFSERDNAIDSVAVLPFANVGNESQLEYLPDGLTESLIDSLSQLPALRVSARNTVASYKGREVDPRQAGGELQVRALVTGRVLWQGDRLIIRVELVDTADGSRLWGDEFRRGHSNIVTVQGEIAREIAAKLQRRLSPDSQQQLARRHSTDSQAYELYAQGRYLYLRYTRESQEKALDYFRQAIALDPRYALAYCGVADVYADFSSQHLPPSEAMPKAREAALKAIELDETLPEAHHSLALVKLWGDWDWVGAEREYKRALELNPNFVLSRIYYAELLSHQKRFEEALRVIKRAEEYDPVSIQAMTCEGYIYFLMRQPEQAIAIFNKLLELSPNTTNIQRQLGLALSQQGRHQEAIAQVSQFRAPVSTATQLAWRAYIYARAGQRDEALRSLRELKAQAAQGRVPPLYFTRVYLGLGDKEQAFAWLRRGYEERSDHLLRIGVDPVFDPLRSDPRFDELLRGIGLAPRVM